MEAQGSGAIVNTSSTSGTRWTGAAQVANAALFHASDEARFITGTEFVVDGGMSVRCD